MLYNMGMDKLTIIGLAGTNGSGKDSVGQILADKYGYLFVSVSDILRRELERRGLEITRLNMRTVGNEWRRQSVGVLVDKAVEEFNKSSDKYAGLAIASIRNPGEADRVHELGGTVLWVDADPKVRYERIQANAAARARAGEDQKTYEQFLSEETAEMNQAPGTDDAVLNMAEVKKLCDVFITNDTTDLAQLQASVAKNLGLE